MTVLTSSKQISAVSIITLWISLSPKRLAISPFTFLFFNFFFCTFSFFTPSLLLVLNCSYAKERLPKDYCQSHKYSKITLSFSSFVTGCDIRSADALVSIQIRVCWLTNIMFIEGVGNLIVNILPVQQRFLLNIVGLNGVDKFINYRAASAD